MEKLLSCGHSKNARIWNKEKQAYIDGCTFCGTTEFAEELPPSLEKREAICGCGRREPSINFEKLAFFEFCGEGSEKAKKICKCNYHENAHINKRVECTQFEPKGALEFDQYYCGCRGWE